MDTRSKSDELDDVIDVINGVISPNPRTPQK
jgi:hypothetical protein